MKSLIRWTVENSPAINTLMITVLAVGTFCLFGMRRETFPEFELDIVLVTVDYPGASPSEIEEGICQKIEEVVQPLAGIKKVMAVSQEGSGFLLIELEPGSDAQKLLNEIRSKIDSIRSFPELAEDPRVTQITLRQPAIRIGVIGPDTPDADAELHLRNLAEQIRDEVVLLPTVSQARVESGRKYQIDIEIPEDTLRRHGLTLRQVAHTVRRQSIELPGGTLRGAGQEFLVRGKTKGSWGPEIERLPLVTQPNGVVLTVGDLGVVRDSLDDTPSFSRINGRPGEVILVERTATEDLLTIVEEVREFVAGRRMPPGFELVAFGDESGPVRDRMELLTRDSVQGLALVFLVLAIFLELRLAFWVSLGMPVAVCGAAIYLYYADQTLNMLSMFGFLMALGIVVDDAIVISENIYAHHQRGASPVDAAIEGTWEVLPSVMASVGTQVLAFAPLLFVSGVMGKFIAVLPTTVIATLVISVVETTATLPCHLAHRENLVVTLLGYLLWPFRPIGRLLAWLNRWTERGLDRLSTTYYVPVVHFFLDRPLPVMGCVAALMIVTAGFVPAGITPWILLPKMDGNIILAKLAYPDGTPLDVTQAATERLERAIRQVNARYAEQGTPLIQLTHRHVGHVLGLSSTGPEAPTDGGHVAQVLVELLPAGRRPITSEQVLVEWRKAAGELSGTDTLLFESFFYGPGGKPIEMKLLAPAEKMASLEAAVEKVKTRLREYPGVLDVGDDSRPGKWELQPRIHPRARAMGVTEADLAEAVRGSFHGEEVMRLQRGRQEVKLMVRYPPEQRRSIADLNGVRVRLDDGAERPLTELADVRVSRGYSEINRLNQLRSISIWADVDELRANARVVTADLQRTFLPGLLAEHPGVTIRWEGQQAESQESVRSLVNGFLVSLLAMFVLLTIEFRSYFQPLLVLVAIPFGFVGATWGHALLGMPLTLFSLFGLVALTGVVVNDSIVMIDFINAQTRAGMPLREAVTEAGRQRLRPILLNSSTTIVGLIPLMLERSFQAQVLIPMAVSMAFGMLLSTTLVLLLLPTFYYATARLSDFLERLSPHDAP